MAGVYQQSLAERFAAKVDMNGRTVRQDLGPCHVWTGCRDRKGYGKIYLGAGNGRRTVRAPRVALFLAHGEWPTGQALHRCDNSQCVRAEHLFDGSPADNMRDCVDRGHHDPARGEASGMAKLTDDLVRAIRAARGSQRAIAAQFGVSKSTVGAVRLRQLWKHVA